MSSAVAHPTYLWLDDVLQPIDDAGLGENVIVAADSWLVFDGRVLGIDLHRKRFASAVSNLFAGLDLDEFWNAVVTMIPGRGDWFPRVELQSRDGAPVLLFRHRVAPIRFRSVTLASHDGADPRRSPSTKGPDLEAMDRLRTQAQSRGADDAVLLSPDGFVIECATSALLWWRGNTLCGPPGDLERIDSITARTINTIAEALGVDVMVEAVAPAELDGLEVWAVNSLHGIRVVTRWVDGPQLAEEPGRAELWRLRLHRLSRPLGELTRSVATLKP